MFNWFKKHGKFEIISEDITKIKTDVIVNAANKSLAPGGGVCGAIYRAAGVEKLDNYITQRQLSLPREGAVVMTPAFDLPANIIIHTAGPIYIPGNDTEFMREELFDCYHNSLRLALSEGFHSIAFPLISSGIYGYPKDEAIGVAVDAITRFMKKYPNTMDVKLIIL